MSGGNLASMLSPRRDCIESGITETPGPKPMEEDTAATKAQATTSADATTATGSDTAITIVARLVTDTTVLDNAAVVVPVTIGTDGKLDVLGVGDTCDGETTEDAESALPDEVDHDGDAD